MIARLVLSSFFALTVTACGNSQASPTSGQTVTLTPGQAAAQNGLAAELPTLTGDFVWDMVEAESKVEFQANYNGDFTGRFPVFQTAIQLDPNNVDGAQVHAIIDLTDIELVKKNSEVTTNLPKPAWFDTANYPNARFSSSSVEDLGGGNYAAMGDLTLKGTSRSAKLVFSLNVEGDRATARGGLEIMRNNFNVGTGTDFETDDWVKFPVKVTVYIVAKR